MSEFKNFKIVFLGTPQFAVPSLQKLLQEGFNVALVITQPDRPAGRGQKIVECPVKRLALAEGLSVKQPQKFRQDTDLIAQLKDLKPDLMITAAFGQIISEEIIAIPKWGIWNVHASLLPKWRGAAPINWSILNGDTETGVTIMLTEKGIDTGNMLSKAKLPIQETDTAETLTEKLSFLGADLLVKTIKQNIQQTIVPEPQNHEEATHAPKLNKELGQIKWKEMTAAEICLRVRALHPWPGVSFALPDGSVIKVHEAVYSDAKSESDAPGTLLANNKDEMLIQCAKGVLRVKTLQPPNKNKMLATDWLRGIKLEIGTQFL